MSYKFPGSGFDYRGWRHRYASSRCQ
jgi:NAD(P)-dependent dehydrogenase (short-subunit alcohol dehydrogenase family)